jgi:hypothetical protein
LLSLGGGSWAVMYHRLGVVSILLLAAGIMVAAWVAVRCGIRASIEKERENGEEG